MRVSIFYVGEMWMLSGEDTGYINLKIINQIKRRHRFRSYQFPIQVFTSEPAERFSHSALDNHSSCGLKKGKQICVGVAVVAT